MTAVWRWLWFLLPANPILVRIVQGGSRRMRHFWVRVGYLGILILLVLFGLLSGDSIAGRISMTELAKAGTKVFAAVAYGQILFICMLAPLFMAGAIRDEQQEANFDILLTTPLSNLQIVLGSLMGRLFFILALIASGLPLFAVLMIVGGVPVVSVFVAFAVAALVAILVGAVAVTLAVLRLGGRKAVYVFMIGVVGYLVLIYAADQLIRFARTATVAPTPVVEVAPAAPAGESTLGATTQTGGTLQGKTTFLTPLHPLLVLEASLNSATYQPFVPEELPGAGAWQRFYFTRPLGAFAVLTLSISLSLVLWAAIRVRTINTGEQTLFWKLRRKMGLAFPIGDRKRLPRTVWHNPIAWREAVTGGTAFGRVVARWGFFGLGIGAALALLWVYHTDRLPAMVRPSTGRPDAAWLFRNVLIALLTLEIGIITLVAIYMSAGAVSREREDGTLDLLLTTPITPRYYVWGKLRGLVSFLGILIAVPVLTLLLVVLYVQVGTLAGWTQKTTIDTLELASTWDYYDSDYDDFAEPADAATTGTTTTAGTTGTAQANVTPRILILPEVVLLLPAMLVPFIALCVAVGMQWSIKARSVLGAVLPTVGVIGVILLTAGFCGMTAAEQIPFVGPILNAFSPMTSVIMLLNPWETVADFTNNRTGSAVAGRISLVMGAIAAAGGYSIAVYAMVTGMTRSFDHTVRKLTGTQA